MRDFSAPSSEIEDLGERSAWMLNTLYRAERDLLKREKLEKDLLKQAKEDPLKVVANLKRTIRNYRTPDALSMVHIAMTQFQDILHKQYVLLGNPSDLSKRAYTFISPDMLSSAITTLCTQGTSNARRSQ